jgi:NAD(P)H-dependent flavin oxidoreductase YrpB (nitropropane dioxygenase family)
MTAIDRRRLLEILGFSVASLATGCSGGDTADVPEDEANGDVQEALSGGCSGLLTTRLVTEYGVKYPFVGAGMSFVSLANLTAAVTNAGGIGVIGAAPGSPDALLAQIQAVKSMTSGLFGVDFINSTGAGGPFTTDAHIDVCIQQGVKIVVFFFETPPAAWVDRLHSSGAKVWMQVSSVAGALEAAAVGVDAIIAQGSQAGGHNRSKTPTLTLVPQIVNAVGSLMVLAAGGIADGKSVAKALAHGADGVWVGTRLVASTEAYAHINYKHRIVQACSSGTVRTTMFGPEWPDQKIRVLRNRVTDRWAGKESHIPTPPPPPAVIGSTVLFGNLYPMPKFSAIIPTPDTTGDLEEMCMPAGSESTALVHDIKPAGHIIVEMMTSAHAIMKAELSH